MFTPNPDTTVLPAILSKSSSVALLDNLNAAQTGNIIILAATNRYAVSFTVGSARISLDSLTAAMSSYDVGDVPTITIQNDSGSDTPSTLVGSFTVPGYPSPQGAGVVNYTFLPSTQITLAANTKYWLMWANGAATAFNWRRGVTPPTANYCTYGSYKFSIDSGVTWSALTNLGIFQLTGTPK